MKRLCLLFVLVGLVFHASAQTGHYFLSHYKPGNDNISYLSFDIKQDNNGILYFANRSGVLQFDGRTWTMVPVGSGIYSLAVTAAGVVYAGGPSGFGKMGLNGTNQLSYLSLSDSLPKAKNIFAAYAHNNAVYFLNEENLFEFDLATAATKIIFSTTAAQGLFTGLFQIGPNLYLESEHAGLKKINGTALEPSDVAVTKDTHLIFSKSSPDEKTYLIANVDHRLFLQKEGSAAVEFFPKDIDYLVSNVVANCTWVTEKLVAIGTLRGGVVFIDIDSGETQEISNYYAGLPDDEVYALLTDRHLGVWVAHDYGFTRAAPFLPFRTFNHYPGLAGNLLCVQSFNDQVYVGTTLGLFVLVKEEIFEDETYNVTRTVAGKTEPVTQTGSQPVRKKRKAGILNRFKKKGLPEEMTQSQPTTATTSKSTKVQVQKTRKVLKGVEYVYKRVEGISGKADQLLVVGDKLLCGGVGGIFEVKGLTSTSLSRKPMRTVFYSKNLKQILVSTYDDQIKSFRSDAKGWEETAFPDTLSMYADYFFEDNLQDLWICGRDRAVKVGIEEGEILDAETIPLPYTSIDRTVGLSYGSEVYLTQNGEFFHYASFKNQFVKYDSLPGPKKYFASAGYFWFYDGHKWRTVDRRLQGSIKTEWLALFPDIRFLAPAEQGKSLWVITASNELYRFSSDQNQGTVLPNPLFLKEVRSQQTKLLPQQVVMVDEQESALTFEFIQPEYVSLQAVEYRYWVKGLQIGWSDWSALNNVINFPFLPPGKYKVQVQSKDLFGKITELNTVEFNVLPPYWKRPWFYALEFFLIGSLVALSLRVKSSRYGYLSRFLSALTVIILIQLIQTVAYSTISLKSTPVADFFIQVVIALLVLPVEEFLRSRITKANTRRVSELVGND
jgi:hypothetical protein